MKLTIAQQADKLTIKHCGLHNIERTTKDTSGDTVYTTEGQAIFDHYFDQLETQLTTKEK